MRVLYWPNYFVPDLGGIEVLSALLLPRLRKLGHELVVVASSGPSSTPGVSDFDGIPVHRFPMRKSIESRDLRKMLSVRKAVRDLKLAFRPDLVHVHPTDPSFLFHLQTERDWQAPALISLHTHLDRANLSGAPDTALGSVLRGAKWVTAVSESLRQTAVGRAPEIETRSSVVYNGLAAPGVEPTRLDFDRPTILCLGRLVPQKAVHLAIEAFAKLEARFPTARLCIAGDGPDRRELEAQVATAGLGKRVEFRGPVVPEAVPSLLNEAAIVVMPSLWEGFPMVALEAGQMGRPLVTTSWDGAAEIVDHERTGLIAELGDAGALADALTTLLSEPATARSMGEAARRLVLERFGIDACAARYDELYRRLADSGSRA